jgi:diguanylate cyclase (GGDEF)-like protein
MMPAPASLSLTRRLPVTAAAISAAALAVPVLASLLAPGYFAEYALLLWLLAVIPPFLLAYYRGWQGAAAALAAAMAVLSTTQAILLNFGKQLDNWPVLLASVGLYTVVTLGIGMVTELLHRAREEAAELALTDELTGLPNRRYARLILEKEFEAARRGRPLVLVLFDLDRFKEYNDIHGHASGDAVLRSFSTVLATTTRKMNVSARFGGEEFLSVVSSADVPGALVFTERVRAGLAHSQPEHGQVTVSVGVAAYQPGMTSPDELLAAADQALYAAKHAGRDCVRVAEPATPPVAARTG